MTFHVVIPARFASTRLPGKPLLKIRGKPMIQWVAELSERSGAESVAVATDHAEIAALFTGDGKTSAVMTRPEHPSGTDRVAEVARQRGWGAQTIVVNVQGDEPQLPYQLIDQVAGLLRDDSAADLATLCTPILSLEEFLDPNVVKVTMTNAHRALYFSRAPIPWSRDSASSLTTQRAFTDAFRHLGIYAYRVGALLKLTQLPVGTLEHLEKLEQLRALQNGLQIAVAIAKVVPGPGIDTQDDLERLRGAN